MLTLTPQQVTHLLAEYSSMLTMAINEEGMMKYTIGDAETPLFELFQWLNYTEVCWSLVSGQFNATQLLEQN